MRQVELYDVIRCPIVSEKSSILSSYRKYVFKVQPDSTKAQVKRAIESIFKVKVTKVNIINTKGKTKTFRGVKGVQNDVKKAIVTLSDKHEIDLSVGVK
ncbi:MAG: 50S ribosomal protein L23 [Alphaproteobacteria bacterium]|nr:50S ribosomal protein L23 [Alphaproteobacteria bacterium]